MPVSVGSLIVVNMPLGALSQPHALTLTCRPSPPTCTRHVLALTHMPSPFVHMSSPIAHMPYECPHPRTHAHTLFSHMPSPSHASPHRNHLAHHHLTRPHLTRPHLTRPHLTRPHILLSLTSHPPSLRSPSLVLTSHSPHRTRPHLARPRLTRVCVPHNIFPHISPPSPVYIMGICHPNTAITTHMHLLCVYTAPIVGI